MSRFGDQPEVVVHDHAVGHTVKEEFGVCTHCPDPAVVKINGTPLCIPHMNEQFVGISKTVRHIVDRVNEKSQ